MADAEKGILSKIRATLRVREVVDALQNSLTGYGTSRSKVAAGVYVADPILHPCDLEVLFSDNDLARTIVARPVEDALRAGFRIERKENAEADLGMADKICARLEELKAHEAMQRGGIFGRLFGGAGSVLGVKGAGGLETPLDPEKGELVSLTDWDRQDMTANTYYPNGDVETYLWQRPSIGTHGWQPQVVHESRLLTFPGVTTTLRKRNENQGWDLSVLQAVYQTLRSFDSMFSSVDAMFTDASQAVFRLQGLISSLAEAKGSGDNDVTARLRMMDLLRSSAKAIVLDAGDESGVGAETFDVVDRSSLGTLDGVMNQYFVRLAASAKMPLIILLGMSPTGMNATGESELLIYFNNVDVYRTFVLTPRAQRLVRMVARALGDSDPDSWTICWPELQRPKPLDVATAEKMKIDSAIGLVTAMAVLPEEVALSLGTLAPTLGITIDKEARRKALTEALKELGDREMTGPTETPEMEPDGVSPETKATERKTPAKAAGGQT